MNESKMNRGLKNRHLQLISLGGVIGSGYFLGTGYVLEKAGPAAILAYLLGGVIVLCVMLCLAELAVEKPVSGSFVTYAREHISPTWACGVGWAYWTTWVAYVPSEMIAAGIIMNNFIPEVSQLWWAVFFGLLVTILNLFHVDKFGESEFWLSLIKIIALAAFSIVAGLICLGLIGDQGYIGTKVLLGSGGFAPNGYWSIVLTMVIILVNFQGTEIIGLAAGECEKPEKSIPIAVRNVTWRILRLRHPDGGHLVLELGPLRCGSRPACARAHGHGPEHARPHQQERHAVALHPRLDLRVLGRHPALLV